MKKVSRKEKEREMKKLSRKEKEKRHDSEKEQREEMTTIGHLG